MRSIKKVIFMTLNLFVILSPARAYYGDAMDIILEEKKEIEETNNKESQESLNEDSEDAVDEFEDNNITYKVINDDKVMFFKYTEPDEESILTVPDCIKYGGIEYKVDYIYEKAFNKEYSSQPGKCMIKEIVISDGVKGFCNDKGKKLHKARALFKNQKKLEKIDFGNTDVQWAEECFYKCENLKSIEVPENITRLVDSTFYGCSSLEKINLENIREFEGRRIFENCISLKDIGRFNDEVKSLPRNMFTNCRNLEISDINNVTKIDDQCFMNCIKLNDTVVNNLQYIGRECFSGCSSFNTVRFNNIKNIGEEAFSNCSNLNEVIFDGPLCPDITHKIDNFTKSNITKYTFPVEYIGQHKYNNFLRNLSIKVTYFFDNHKDMPKAKKLHRDSLYDLYYDFKPADYKILNWYKDEELTVKVEKTIDTGIIENGKLIIENPVLFGECMEKKNEGNDNSEEDNNDDCDQDIIDDNDKYEEKDEDINDNDDTGAGNDGNEGESSDENSEDGSKNEDEKDDSIDDDYEYDKNEEIDKDKNDVFIEDNIDDDKNENQESNSTQETETDNNESDGDDEEFKDKTVENNNVSKSRGKRRVSADDNLSKNAEMYKIIIVEKSRLKPGINRFYILNPILKNTDRFSDRRWINIYCDYKNLCDKNKVIIRYYYDTDNVDIKWIV